MSKSLGKRILAITLSVLMVMTLLPTGMFAADTVEVTADNYQELLSVPLSVNAYMQDHVNWGWNGNGWNSTTLGGTVSVDEDWFGDTYDSILTSDNTSEWTVNPSFCLSITDGGYLTESGVDVGYTGDEHTYNFTYSDIVIAANGYNDVTISGATVETVFQYVQYSGYYGGTSYDIDLLTPIMEQLGLTLQQVAEEYIPAIYNVKFSATLNSFDGVSYSDIQAFLDEGGSGETGGEEDPGTTTSVLPWELTSTDYVNDWTEMTFYQAAINGFTYGGYQWSTLIQDNSSSNYSGSLALWDGFIEALLSDNATFEITSTSANTYLILQAGGNFGYGLGVSVNADSVVDNGDGTYTTTISCASALSAFASATQEGYEGSPAVPTSTSDYGDLFGLVISSSDESATLSSFKIVDSTASSGGETGGEETEATDTSSWVVVLQGFDTEYSGWAYTTLSDAGVLSYSVPLQTILDANNLDLAGLGGVQFSVNGLTLTEDRSAGISDGVTLYYRVYINDELYVSSSSEIVTDTTWSSYTFLTLNYEANFGWDDYYNYSADDVLYAEVSLTAFDDEDEPTVVALPWVDEAVAENTLTLSGQQWWYGIIYCTEAYDGEAGTYDAGVSSDLDGFLKAIACDDAVIEIVSTGSGIDQIFLQKASDYSGTDSLNMTVTDNGDGTYTSTISGAELSAYADAVVEEGDSVWKVLVNKTTDCDTVITSISVYVPSSTSLPWVDEPLAENTYTISGQGWWRQLIICSESASEETYDNYVSTDMEGFLAAIAEDDAVLEITSTGSGVDQIFFQYKISDDVYDATDAVSLTITDNGDGTYTSSVSGANLNALVTAFEAEGCSAWKLYINKTTDCETVITSMQVVEGSVVVDEEFDLSSYTLWSTEEVNVTSGIWNSYSFTDGSWADALAYDGAILVITRDSTDYSSGYDNFFFQDSSNWSSLGLGSGTSSADISCAFDNGEMVVYTGSTVYNALASRGMSPDVFVSNSDADPTYTITSVSVYIPTATILAANQELIDYLSSLMDTDEVIYINQTDADEGYDESGYLNYFLYVYYITTDSLRIWRR